MAHLDPTKLLEDDERDRLIDRLVDNELDAGDRRALLEALDGSPDGWRACALAFVEAQSFSGELSSFAADSLAAPQVAASPSESPRSESRPRSATIPGQAVGARRPVGRFLFALAASALLAFGLGALVQRFGGVSGHRTDPGSVAGVDSVPGLGPEQTDDQQLLAGAAPPPAAIDQATLGQLAPGQAAPGQLGESVTFWVEDAAGGRRELSAPLVDAEEVDQRLGLEFPTRVTPGMRQRFEGRGMRLQTRRRYASLFLEDGQPLMVPVEDVQIVPVKGAAL